MNKRPFDTVITLTILLAAIAGIAYLGPWLLFDVLKVGNLGKPSQSVVKNAENVLNDGLVLQEDKRVSLNLNNDDLFSEVNLIESEKAGPLVDTSVFRTLNWYKSLQKIAQVVKNQPVTPDARRVSRVIPAVNPDWNKEGTWVIAEKIGLETQVLTPESSDNLEEALEQGVIKIADYGMPGDKGKLPMILAAHRFGYQWWWRDPNYGRQHSFYYLPDLAVGDLVQVVDDEGRKWYYEIYATTEGEQIDDYQADLIMYTCKFLNSSQRYFQYARLIDPSLYGNYPGTELGGGTEIEFVDETDAQAEIKHLETDVKGRTWVKL